MFKPAVMANAVIMLAVRLRQIAEDLTGYAPKGNDPFKVMLKF
jgi:hypothetical protein